MSDTYAEMVQDFEDSPAKSFPPKPEVWALVEVMDGAKYEMGKYEPLAMELYLPSTILQSGVDGKGKDAKGMAQIRLRNPKKGDAAFTGDDGRPSKRFFFLKGLYTSVLAALLAPNIPNVKTNQEQVAKTVADALDAAGGPVGAVKGKRMLIQFKINDGCQGTAGTPTVPGLVCKWHGKPVFEAAKARVDKPVNDITNYEPATDANITRLLGSGGASGGATTTAPKW